MKILVSGSSGLIGTELVKHLRRADHEVRTLTRQQNADVFWDPQTGTIDHETLKQWNGPDAVAHLAGENIASQRWTAAKKQRIRESRVSVTEKLCRTLKTPIFVSASGIGFYGDRADEIITEESPAGSDFLARVCVDWERAADVLKNAGTRVAHLRFGMVVAAHGGALQKMLPFFRMGLGGQLGSGRQWMSWITLEDAVRLIANALVSPALRGAYNAVAPEPVTNREFTKALGRVLHRPTITPVPTFALRLMYGEMAEALLLTSQRAVPKRLHDAGFRFSHPNLEPALEDVL